MPCPEASCISPSDCYNGKCETAHGPSWCLAPGTSQGQKDKVNTLLAKREGVTSKQESGSHSMLTTQVAAWRGIAPLAIKCCAILLSRPVQLLLARFLHIKHANKILPGSIKSGIH